MAGIFEDTKETNSDECMLIAVDAFNAWRSNNPTVRPEDVTAVRSYITFFMKEISVEPGPHNEELLKQIFNPTRETLSKKVV